MRREIYCIELMLCILILTCPVRAQYSGGTGEPGDPYQIATATDLILLGDNPDDYDKHFILTADIDLDSNLPGGKVFTNAVIAPGPPCLNIYAIVATASDPPEGRSSTGIPFTGVFDGNGYTISNLTITGGSYLGLFGYLGLRACIYNLGLEAVHINGTGPSVGALAGCNYGGEIIMSYSTGMVTGIASVGGLVGYNWNGYVTSSYSSSTVNGVCKVGGLVGCNRGSIIASYSIGKVTGSENAGGLVGQNYKSVTSCFWDMDVSGQTSSAGGEGKSTAEMQTAGTFLEAGLDFAGETANGEDDIWWIHEGQNYPRLFWQYGKAFSPYPQDRAVDFPQPLILSWLPGGPGLQHDIYLDQDKDAVANATTESTGIYRGRQAAEITTCDPGNLMLETTYYWRVDEVNESDANSLWNGDVWCFTTANFFVVDDFESYSDENPLSEHWNGWHYNPWPPGPPDYAPYFASNVNVAPVGFGPTTGSGCEEVIVHGGNQSMPFTYENNKTGFVKYSETGLTLTTTRDWTEQGITELSLWFIGTLSNDAEPLYVAVSNAAGIPAVVVHPDSAATQINTWTEWVIPLQMIADQGIHLGNVDRITIGIGTRGNMTIPGGQGKMYFDDIRLYRPRPEPESDISGEFSNDAICANLKIR